MGNQHDCNVCYRRVATLVFLYAQRQGKTLKFDHRDQTKNNRNFLFSDQVKDNMFWSMTSGVVQVTLFQVVTMWLMANGIAPVMSIAFKSNLVCSGIYAVTHLVRFSFLLGTPLTAHPILLYKLSFITSSQY